MQVCGFWQAVPVLCLLGRTREARAYAPGDLGGFHDSISMVEGFQLLLDGDQAGGQAALETIATRAHRKPFFCVNTLPVFLAVKHLESSNSAWDELQQTVAAEINQDQQGIRWSDARLVLGHIDDQKYLAQPRQYPDPHRSLPLFQAIRADLNEGVTKSLHQKRDPASTVS